MTNSGLKAIDNLIVRYGIAYTEVDNAFQRSIVISACDSIEATREAIKPFGLKHFPHSIWLKLTTCCGDKQTILHQFKLPQLDGRVFCWVLLDQDGHMIELACCMNKISYVKAAKHISHLIIKHPDASLNFTLAYG